MFAYCNNNAVNASDSLGYKPVSILEREGDKKIPVPPRRNSKKNKQNNKPGKQDNNNTNSKPTNKKPTAEEKVIQAKIATVYKGKPVIKIPGASAGFSCGIMFIGSNVSSPETIKHEYGHTKQLDALGLPAYMCTVVVPSVICFALTESNEFLNENYFSLPWERKADELGEATDDYLPGSGWVSEAYWIASKAISRSLF